MLPKLSGPRPRAPLSALLSLSRALDLVYEFRQADIDPTTPLIYLWEIADSSGAVIYRYVGKASNGAGRPIEHYRRNVRRLLSGQPAHPPGDRERDFASRCNGPSSRSSSHRLLGSDHEEAAAARGRETRPLPAPIGGRFSMHQGSQEGICSN